MNNYCPRALVAGPAMCALAALIVPGCRSAPQAIPAGTFVSSISGTRSELDGEWALAIERNGRFSLALNGQPAVTGTYASTGDRMTLTDESGPMMCAAGTTTGIYSWTLKDSDLSLAAITDDCSGRRGLLGRQPLRRKP